ncbi:phospholipase D family protein [Aquamicrobium zhengzhouense]|uniref:Phospholipase D n=1 Tax=Aquamicrobium zhengzhouense TaxID=2781738 RepID=A0ABS0SEF2_9HYPH|nr:phospholipase D family protein [Aquamicrobium zhengzhouense]MBI1621025.1 phospholipase D family protein [Aquamicrobium zhengzhouense]
MEILLVLTAGAGFFAAASFLAVLSYGYFARRSLGAPSHALETELSATELDRAIAPMLERHDGQSGLALISGNLDAFAVRALSARAAGRSLDLMYYYWKGDLTGRLLMKEVLGAADRGVRVRLLIDDINMRGLDRAYRALDTHPNIAVRLFNPSRARHGGLRRGIEMVLRFFSVTRRMHNKAWIVDGRLAIVGGRNIGDAYFGAAETSNFRDIDMMMVGPVVQGASKVFDAYWNSEVAMPIRSLIRPRRGTLRRLRKGVARISAKGRASPYIEQLRKRMSALAMLNGDIGLHWTREAKIVSDPPEKALARGAQNWIMSSLMPVIMSAEKSVSITSPYFVPGVDGSARLIGLVAKGVDVAVLTNSLSATDVAAVHGGYAPYRRTLLAGGVRLFELQKAGWDNDMSLFGSRNASLHTKAFIVDGKTAFVGSFNFDPRSVSLNTEMGILFSEDVIVKMLQDLFDEETTLPMSYRLSLNEKRSIIWEGEEDGVLQTWDREPEASARRRALAKVVSLLPIESQL